MRPVRAPPPSAAATLPPPICNATSSSSPKPHLHVFRSATPTSHLSPPVCPLDLPLRLEGSSRSPGASSGADERQHDREDEPGPEHPGGESCRAQKGSGPRHEGGALRNDS